MRPRVIAVDFDGTLCINAFPEIGAPIPQVIEYVKRQKAAGNIIILWTCRTGQNLSDAVTWCNNQGLMFDYINENVKENVEQYGGDTRKVWADVYIDDKTLLPQQIIIKESIEMTNKEKQELTASVAGAVIAEVDDILATHFCTDTYYVARAELNALADKYGVKRTKLADLTWEEIAEIAARGEAAATFRIGDEKEFELITGERLTAVIVGFDHDVVDAKTIYGDGRPVTTVKSRAGITFAVKEILDGWFEMNNDDTNKGGWAKSKMRTVYMSRLDKLLPAELAPHIRTVVKSTTVGGGSDKVDSCPDRLFLFSENEITGDGNPDEGAQYPYFADAANRVKYRKCDGSAYSWWLRSPNAGGATYFYRVNSTGNVNGNNASYSNGVSFGFCL